jgi:O-antigen/teichoic acid export membrane protein
VPTFFNFFSKQTIRFSTAGSVLIKFSAAFFAFLNSIILARYLGKEGFGMYVLAYATVLIISVPVTMGLPMLLTRFISKYKVSENYQAIKGILILSHKYVLRTVIIVYILAFISYFFWWKQYESSFVETLSYGFILVPLLAFAALRTATLRGLKYVILAELPDTFLRNFLFTLFLLSALFFNLTLTPQRVMIFQIAVTAISFLIGFVLLQKKLLVQLKTIHPIFFKKEWITQTIPFTVNSSVQIVKNKLLSYILAIFGNVEQVAIFEVALRGASLVSFTLDALNLAIAPYISTAFEKGNLEQIQRIIKKTGRIIFLFSLPVALVFIIGGQPILKLLYGQQYNHSYTPLVILCVGQLVSSLIGSVGLLLNMTGNQSVLSRSNVIALLINCLLSIPLVIYFNTIGAALVYSFVLIIQNIYLLYYVKKRLNLTTVIF